MNKIHILTINDRKEVFEITKNFWESHGWEVIPEYNRHVSRKRSIAT